MDRGTIEHLEQRFLLSSVHPAVVSAAAIIAQPTGALTGKIVYTSGGHGYTADAKATGVWLTGRPLSDGIVEDFGNQDQMTQFVNYAFNAGATVVPMRPVGYQPNEVILDNTSAGVTFSGTWGSGGTGSGTHYFFSLSGASTTSRYRFAAASTTETAVARYTPTISAAGVYPVYAFASFAGDRLIDQTYRITYDGGVEEVKVNHRMVGNGWIYLGSYYFNAGSSGYVEISNKSSATGNAIADAIRFGNGIGDIPRGGAVSGHSREDESSLYWVEKQALNTYQDLGSGTATLIDPSNYQNTSLTDDSQANVSAPIRWAKFMNNEAVGSAADRIFLSFHSNASGAEGGSRGTLGLYNGNNTPSSETPHQYDLALDTAKEINDDLTSLGSQLEYPWFNKTAAADLTLDRTDIEFGEINNVTINNEFDATIDEVGFHDNIMDADDLLDPKVRAAIGHAATQGLIRYFNTFSNVSLNFAPSAPTDPRALTAANGDVTVTWTAPLPSSVNGDAATSYLLQSSTDGHGFDAGIAVTGTSYTFAASSLGAGAQFFRVVAVNIGGASPASVVVGARKNPYGKSTILIVNGFDRLDRAEDPTQTTALQTGATPITTYRIRPQYSNSFDYVTEAGLAVAAYSTQLGFDSAQHADIVNGTVNLSNYDTVIWLSGEQSSTNQTFTAAEQSAVSSYVSNGGHLFVSGSEIGYDLVSQSHGSTFYTGTLHAGYGGDDANTYNATGASNSIFAGLSFSFDNGTQFYNVDYPDRLTASGGSSIALNYSGGTNDGAGVQFSGSNGSNVVNFGFPFETITTTANRASVMSAVLTYFGVGTPAATPLVPQLSSASDTGVSNSDGITRLNNSPGNVLTFAVGGTVAGATVSVFAGSQLIGQAVATGATTTIISDGSMALPDGTYAVSATQSTSGRPASGNSSSSGLIVDTIAPALSASEFDYNLSQQLNLTFSETVSASLDASDVALLNRTTAQTVSGFSLSNTGTSAAITFSSLLSDGYYRATLLGSGIADVAGNALSGNNLADFFVLAGDANHDGAVNIADLGMLATNYGNSNTGFTGGDFNYDGVVSIADLGILATNYGVTLPPSPRAFPANAKAASAVSSAASPAGHAKVKSNFLPLSKEVLT